MSSVCDTVVISAGRMPFDKRCNHSVQCSDGRMNDGRVIGRAAAKLNYSMVAMLVIV